MLASALRFTGLIAILVGSLAEAENTTCAGNALDWYSDAVGETPCITYQRLRQICNSEYQVPTFSNTAPGDKCNDQLTACCCNSIAFSLSMLCMNCQQDTNGGNVNGIDAGNGAYYKYLDGCGSGTNESLPVAIQTAVCNEGIKLDNFLYNLFWNTGAWFYTYTREAAGQDQVSENNDTFTHCPSSSASTTASSSTSTASIPTLSSTLSSPTPVQSTTGSPDGSSSSASSTVTSSRASTSTVVGGVVGGILGFTAIILCALYLYRRQRIAALQIAVQGRSSALQTGENGARLSLTPTISPFIVPAGTSSPPLRYWGLDNKRALRKASQTPLLQTDSNVNLLGVDTTQPLSYATITQPPPSVEPTLTYMPSTRSRVTRPPSGRPPPPTYRSSEN